VDEIAVNADMFSRQLSGLADFTDGLFEKVVRKTCFDLYARIVKRTPVDTGRAKGGWGITTDLDIPDGDVGNAQFTFTIEDDQVIIYNNVEYISDLEHGHSQVQAPNGMVAISLAEFNAHFEQVLHELGGLV